MDGDFAVTRERELLRALSLLLRELLLSAGMGPLAARILSTMRPLQVRMATLWALAGCSASDEALAADAAIVTEATTVVGASIAPSPVAPQTSALRLRVRDESPEPTPISARRTPALRLRLRDESPEPTPISAPREGTCGGLAEAPRTQTWFLHQRVALTIPSVETLLDTPPRSRREMGWVERGDARMAIAVAELFLRAEHSLIAAVRPRIPEGWSIRALGEDVAVAYPRTLIVLDTDTPLGTVYVRDEDNLVLSIEFVTDDDNAARGGCLAFARELARSAVIGPDRVELAARVEHFEGFELDVPEGFASTVDEGPDFAVFHLTRIRNRDAEPLGWLGLYSGYHPSFDAETPSITRNTLGKNITFYDDTTASNRHTRQALIPLGGPILHLFYGSDDAEVFEVVDGAATTLRRRPRAGLPR